MLVKGTKHVKKTQLISLISLVATNVFCLVALSVAWFTAKQTVDNAVDDITAVDASDLSIDYKVYGYDETNAQAGVCKTDDPESFPDPLALSDYDAFISSRNKYTNILVRVEIDFSASTANKNVLLTINCDSTDYTETKTGDDGKTTTSVIDKISNVIQFKCAVYSHTVGDTTTVDIASIGETSAATIYSTASAYFDTVSSYYSFVDIASQTSGDTTTYTYTKPSTKLQILSSDAFAENCDSCVLYLELDYNPELIKHYLDVDTYSTEGSSLDLITSGNQVSFSGDLSSMMVGIGGA